MGTAVVSGGLGAYLLIDQAGEEHATGGERRLALRPHLGPRSTGFSLRLDF